MSASAAVTEGAGSATAVTSLGAAAAPGGRDGVRVALAGLDAAPLSRKRAMLLAMLVDAEVDRRATGDLLAHRRVVAAKEPALATAMEVAAMREHGPRLATETVPADGADPQALSEADYMVSLYNAGTVQRMRIVWPDGARADAVETLRHAVAALERHAPAAPPGPAA
ncbi:hypothetical protein GCM10011490_13480 [Pseudoclavibacter endophyticus]|uniref:Uncharacterized protein n=1 Tax=Pseudoclavibacter endophyticus TaxID=1778590 RepID=A0A6H9WMJ5_9MICO|nr:hypothetical protein [Pseudoclavibacter endophyticus]KAB1649248.1 hypothetical protein F8O04_02940 [Pseudoclavibacter endophyticus]GGA64117.1 hypothetical protein GCM10011490_13480 [Pseudoclavibacter endophyticus]